MAELQRKPAQEDAAIEGRRSGSLMMVLGWIILGMAALVGIFVFNAIRDGDMMWPTFAGILGVIGLGLVIAGARARHRRA